MYQFILSLIFGVVSSCDGEGGPSCILCGIWIPEKARTHKIDNTFYKKKAEKCSLERSKILHTRDEKSDEFFRIGFQDNRLFSTTLSHNLGRDQSSIVIGQEKNVTNYCNFFAID